MKRNMKKHKDNVHAPNRLESSKAARARVSGKGTKLLVFSSQPGFIFGFSFPSQEKLRKNPRAFSCDECDASYTTNQKLKHHKLIKHENVEKKHPCPICGLKFKIAAYVKEHMATVHKPEKYVGHCDECGRGYNVAYKIRECCHEIKIAKFRISQQLAIESGSLDRGEQQLAIEAPNSAMKKNVTVVYSKTPLIFQNLTSPQAKKDN